ncbi:hypothetical protein Pmani_040042 [Petrolisthes manimaculis]|uniref:Major facilitator superfamily (MFS) profile domain-containing protein n=1 Tax=Petrolisthes manimaculis TaxID=1843537 RepID=A0AAE1NCW6_9EUCA|nr:hypothetical protein Pmani_040042 [Petrolisthes manimaculis]
MSNTGGREEILDKLEDNTMNNKGITEKGRVDNESDTMDSKGVKEENEYGHESDIKYNNGWKEEVKDGGGGDDDGGGDGGDGGGGGGGGGGEDSPPDDLSWVTTFEDLLKLVGTKGPWNVMIFFLCSYAFFLTAFNTMSYQFLGATPDHWCLVPVLVEANWTQQQILSIAIPYNNVTGEYDSCHMYDYNYTTVAEMGYEKAREGVLTPTNLTVSCWSRDFNYTQYQSTVVTEWDLVCERKALYSTTQSVLGIGNLAACLVYGIIIDRYGRQRVILTNAILFIIFGNLIVFSPSVNVYILGRGIVSFVKTGLYISCFVFLMESCAIKYRSLVGSLSVIPWALGYMTIPGIAYLVRTWRLLTVCLTLPALVSISYIWILPESPRWLIQKGRHSQALTVLKKAAKMNKKSLPPDPLLLQAMEQVTCCQQKESDADKSIWAAIKSSLPDIPIFGRKVSLIFCIWFFGAMGYFGISFNATNIKVDIYLYIFMSGFLEIPSYLLMWPAIAYYGRKKIHSSLYFVSGVCILLLMALLLLQVQNDVLLLTISLCGKLFITAVYQLTWICTTELYSTIHRSQAVGGGLLMADIAFISIPYVNDILGDLVVWAPSAVLGCASMTAGLLACLLPETRDNYMPEILGETKYPSTQEIQVTDEAVGRRRKLECDRRKEENVDEV